jgi:hypothetical protein
MKKIGEFFKNLGQTKTKQTVLVEQPKELTRLEQLEKYRDKGEKNLSLLEIEHDQLSDLIKSGRKESEVYRSCNMGRDTFSSIINKKNLSVTKKTVVQLCFGLRLSLEDSLKLLAAAGYTLSDGIVFDYVIICYLKCRNYDVDDVNITLYEMGVPDSLLLLQRPRSR